MNQKFRIKNFRVFDNKGAEFDIKPITILTGCNSSGKSSLVKALLLLDDYYNKVKSDEKRRIKGIDLSSQFFDFNNPALKLGKFDAAKHKHSTDDERMSFSYSYSIKDVPEMEFFATLFIKTKEKDFMNNGWMSAFEISAPNDTIVLEIIWDRYGITLKGCDLKAIIPAFQETVNRLLNKNNVGNDGTKSNYKKTTPSNRLTWQQVSIALTDSHHLGRSYNECFRNGAFENDVDTFLKSIMNNEFFYIPNLCDLDSKGKESTLLYLKKQIEDCYNINLRNDIETLLINYTSSECESLLSLLSLEQEHFFNQLKTHTVGPLYGNDKCISQNIIDEFFERETETIISSYIDYNHLAYNIKSPMFFRYVGCLYMCLSEIKIRDLRDRRYEFMGLMPLYLLTKYFSKKVALPMELPCFSNGGIRYVSSDIMDVRRSYEINSNANFANVLKSYHGILVDNRYQKSISLGRFMNRWINRFGIGDRIEIKNNESGMNLSVFIYDDANDTEGHLLADEGYGISQLLSLMMQIEIAIVENDKLMGNTSDCLRRNDSPSSVTIAVEEPEIHLHPRLQSLLADMIVEAHSAGVHFIIETHSEYLIRKLQTLVAQKKLDNNETIIYYMYDPKQDDIPDYIDKVKEIRINEDGSLTDSFGSGFFDESYNLSNELLKVKLGLL